MDLKGKILLRGNGYTYISSMRSDMPFPPESEKLSAKYKELTAKRDSVFQSIELWGTKRPQASNAGYKVMGTDFFGVEIPEDWDIKESTDTIVCWDICSGSNKIGSIRIIPYKSEIIAGDDKTMREYILNDFKVNSSALITLSTKDADADTMKKIKGSLEVAYGGSVLYILSLANRYLELGGISIFGKIDSFNTENGRYTAVNIRAMKYVADDSAKGFHIEDLNQIITYPMDYPQMAPLVGPDYKTYGTYVMFAISSKTFINYCPNYKDLYYDFIIGDNMLKVVVGHYIP